MKDQLVQSASRICLTVNCACMKYLQHVIGHFKALKKGTISPVVTQPVLEPVQYFHAPGSSLIV